MLNSWLDRTYTVFIMFECWLNSFVFSSFLVYFFKYFTMINMLSKCQFWFSFFGENRNILCASSLLQVTWIFLSEKLRQKKFHSLTFLSLTFSGIYSDVPLFFRFCIYSITLDFFFITKKHIHKHSPHTKAD